MCDDPANFTDPDGRAGIPFLQDFFKTQVGWVLRGGALMAGAMFGAGSLVSSIAAIGGTANTMVSKESLDKMSTNQLANRGSAQGGNGMAANLAQTSESIRNSVQSKIYQSSGNPLQKETNPSDYDSRSKVREAGFFLRHPIIALRVGISSDFGTNISSRATRFSINSGLNDNAYNKGSKRNALRHFIWMGSITSEFGISIAKQIGNAHEENPSISNFDTFNSMDEADEQVDLMNNQIARAIASQYKNETMENLALRGINYFYTTGLWVVEELNYYGTAVYMVKQTKLTDSEYKGAILKISKLNGSGFTDEGDKKALKKVIEQTPPFRGK